MEGQTDGWTDGQTDGWTDGRMDGWTDGWTENLLILQDFVSSRGRCPTSKVVLMEFVRFFSAVIQNAIYYGTYLLVFCVLLIYVTSKVGFSFSQLKVICITASNTWGRYISLLMLQTFLSATE